MPQQQTFFQSSAALLEYVNNKAKGHILVTYRNCEDYEGMVLAIIIIFDTIKNSYRLSLEWECLGLDFYGDTLQESYIYEFSSLGELLLYLATKYSIPVTAIPVVYSFDHSMHPSPLRNEERKTIYEKYWQQFQNDFKAGAFSDPSLKTVYDSANR